MLHDGAICHQKLMAGMDAHYDEAMPPEAMGWYGCSMMAAYADQQLWPAWMPMMACHQTLWAV